MKTRSISLRAMDRSLTSHSRRLDVLVYGGPMPNDSEAKFGLERLFPRLMIFSRDFPDRRYT